MSRNRPQRHIRHGGIDNRTGKRRADSVVNPDVPPPATITVDSHSAREGISQLADNHPSNPAWMPVPPPEPTEWPPHLQGFEHMPAIRDAFDAEIITEAAARRFIEVTEQNEDGIVFASRHLTPEVVNAAINVSTAEYNSNPDHNFAGDLVVLLAATTERPDRNPRTLVAEAATAYHDWLRDQRNDYAYKNDYRKGQVTDPNLFAAIGAYLRVDPEMGIGDRTMKLDDTKNGARHEVVATALLERIGEDALHDTDVLTVETYSNGFRARLANGYLVEMVHNADYDTVTGFPLDGTEIRRVHIEADGSRTVVAAASVRRGEERDRFLVAADPARTMTQ